MDIQEALNSNIQMQLDVCSAWGEDEKKAKKYMLITHDCARRAKARWRVLREEKGYQGSLFGIVRAISIRIFGRRARNA